MFAISRFALCGAALLSLSAGGQAFAQPTERDCRFLAEVRNYQKLGQEVTTDEVAEADAIQRRGGCNGGVAAKPAPAPAATSNAPGSQADEWWAKAMAYRKGQGVAVDPVQSMVWTRKAAEAGSHMAQFALSAAYQTGYGGTPINRAEHFRWMKASADNGGAIPANNVGLYYYEGDGVAKDLAAAARYFLMAAQRGEADGQVNIGTAYWEGEGVPKNPAEAVRWFRAAADQGNADGQYWLGTAYRRGLGVAFDAAQARRWYRASAAQGTRQAADALAGMDAIDRDFAARAAAERRTASSQTRPDNGPSLSDQVRATMERQKRENCAAAAEGRLRVCPK